MTASEVLQQEHDRDQLMPGHSRHPSGACEDLSASERRARKVAEKKVWADMEAASILHLEFSLPAMANKVTTNLKLQLQPGEILPWIRGFRNLGGIVRHGDGGVLWERVYQLGGRSSAGGLEYIKSQKRVSVRMPYQFVGQRALREGRGKRLHDQCRSECTSPDLYLQFVDHQARL